MTITEFFSALKGTPRDWRLTPHNTIRRMIDDNSCDQCPVCAVDEKLSGEYTNTAGFRSGARLGIQYSNVQDLLYSADSKNGPYRNQMLRACGLVKANGDHLGAVES